VLGGGGNDVLTGDVRDVLIGDGGDDRCAALAPLRDCER